jgi:hypothetical protein
MAVTSKKKRKSLRTNGNVPSHWTAEWAVEPATTEGWVNVTLTVKQTDGISTVQLTYRYLLSRERASQLMQEMNESLAREAASENLDSTAALVAARAALQAGSTSSALTPEENNTLLDHFALGAYGLVGN